MNQKRSAPGDQKLENKNLNWSVKAMVIAPKFDINNKIKKIEFREWKFSVVLN